MSRMQSVYIACLLSLTAPAASADPQACCPPPTPTDVPETVLTEIEQLLTGPAVRPSTTREQEEARQDYQAHMLQVIDLGYDALDEFPDADNLFDVQQMMLLAARSLYETDNDEANRQQAVAICQMILDGDGSPVQELPADATLTGIRLDTATDEDRCRSLLQAFVHRYVATDAEAGALMNASALARRVDLIDLAEQYADTLAADHPDDGLAARFLARVGRAVPFQAELTTISGRTLSLPNDLLGKVVVVEFWATWCPQSRRSRSHLLQLYRTYKPAGLEIVGISLDPADQAEQLRTFLNDHQLGWIQTHSGRGLTDPTFVHYGLAETPSIWIINRQGQIVTDNALLDPADPASGATLANLRLNIQRTLQQDANVTED